MYMVSRLPAVQVCEVREDGSGIFVMVVISFSQRKRDTKKSDDDGRTSEESIVRPVAVLKAMCRTRFNM